MSNTQSFPFTMTATTVSSFLSAVYRKERTWNNFRPDVMKSGLQKYIRRGLTAKAMYCAGELDLMKWTPAEAGGARAEGMRTNFLHRLMVIFIEDVGIADLGLWGQLDVWMDTLWAERKKAAGERQIAVEESAISNIVTALSAAPKSRSCSHVRAVTYVGDSLTKNVLAKNTERFPAVMAIHQAWVSEVAAGTVGDFEALCTGLKKALAARCYTAAIWADRIAEATGVEVREYRKRKPVWRVFRILEEVLPTEYKALHGLSMKWYSELEGLKEAKLCWLLLVLACIQRPSLITPVLNTGGAGEGTNNWERNREGAVLEVDAYVEDRHTAKGREKSLTEFALVGAYVENESPLVNQEFKAFYEETKRAMDLVDKQGRSLLPPVLFTPSVAVPVALAAPAAPTSPTEAVALAQAYIPHTEPPSGYTQPLQIQLVTSRTKCRAWFATAPNGKQVVVKGPMKRTEVAAVLKAEALKQRLGLPHANVYTEEENGNVFVVADNLLGDYTAFPTRLAATKLEKDSRILDAELPAWKDTMLADKELTRGMLVALAFRKVAGANDACCRNLVVVGDGQVYSVDDAAWEKETPHMWSRALMKQKTAYEAALKREWVHVLSVLESWRMRVEEGSFAAARLAELMTHDGWKW